MKAPTSLLPLALLAFSNPAWATGGFVCKTAGERPIEVVLGVGHVPGAPLIASSLIENGREIGINAPQWWLDSSELRLVLTSKDAMQEELVVKARRNGDLYDGSVLRNGRTRWIRCREN
jgi:hypothetical protein